MGVPGGTVGSIFTPVPCEITCYGPEGVAGNGHFVHCCVDAFLVNHQLSKTVFAVI